MAMKTLASTLRNHFNAQPSQYENAESLLDMIYWYYAEFNSMDSNETKAQFAKLRNALHYLSTQEFDTIFGIVSSLCIEYERTAFTEGLRLGFMLMQELNE